MNKQTPEQAQKTPGKTQNTLTAVPTKGLTGGNKSHIAGICTTLKRKHEEISDNPDHNLLPLLSR